MILLSDHAEQRVAVRFDVLDELDSGDGRYLLMKRLASPGFDSILRANGCRFGLCTPRTVVHFGVLHPIRQAAGVRDARAPLWQLSRAREFANLAHAELIVAAPRIDDTNALRDASTA